MATLLSLGAIFYLLLNVHRENCLKLDSPEISSSSLNIHFLNNTYDKWETVEYSQANASDHFLSHANINATDVSVYFNCSELKVEQEFTQLPNGSLLVQESNLMHDIYYIQNGSVFVCGGQYNSTEYQSEQDPDFSDEFLTCNHFLIDLSEFELKENGDLYISMYSKAYKPGDFYLVENGAYICIPNFEDMSQNKTITQDINKFAGNFSYVTYAGLLLSVVSLILHLIVFCCVSAIRNLPGYCLASLSLSLLIAYVCFLVAAIFETNTHCANIGICIYYFFLTSFFWMNTIAFDVWRTFRVFFRELRISSQRVPWRRFLFYSMYSWLVPAILTVLVKMFDSTDMLSEDFRPTFGHPLCWFGHKKALLVLFYVPLVVIMLLNAAFFLDVAYVITRSSLRTSTTSHEANLKKRFFMFTRLALIMGLTWIVGLIAGYADVVFMWYLFIVLCTLQGVFIFVVFSCGSKVRGICLAKYKKKANKVTRPSTRTTISSFSQSV